MTIVEERILPALIFGASGAVSGAGVGAIGYLFTKKKKNILIGVKYGAGIGALLGFIPELWMWAMPEPFIPPTTSLVSFKNQISQQFEDPYHANLIRVD